MSLAPPSRITVAWALVALAGASAVGACAARCPKATTCVPVAGPCGDGHGDRREVVLRAAVAPDSCARRRVLEEALADPDPQVRLLAALVLIGDEPPAPAAGAEDGAAPRRTTSALREPPARTPNPTVRAARPLTAAERLVADDPWFAGTLLPAAWMASGSADDRVRTIGVRALERLPRDEGPLVEPGPSR
ncbi:MAG: hypothetical protein U1E39_14500 [Planctomycetota bacterium]